MHEILFLDANPLTLLCYRLTQTPPKNVLTSELSYPHHEKRNLKSRINYNWKNKVVMAGEDRQNVADVLIQYRTIKCLGTTRKDSNMGIYS